MGPDARPIPRTPVTSSNIASLGYDPSTLTLAVEFTSGSLFEYRGVPEPAYRAFLEAASKGQHFHKHIRGRFESQAVVERREATCPACGDHGIHGCVCEDCGCANYSEVFQ